MGAAAVQTWMHLLKHHQYNYLQQTKIHLWLAAAHALAEESMHVPRITIQ